MPAPGGERATLSRDLADFLIELSIALHKHAMYPEGHPSLAPAAAAVTRRAGLLLEERSSVSLGVARHQLVIEGVATDPKHPVLRELASRLHRHHLGAVTFRRGLAESEVADVLKAVAVDAERTGQPMGLGDSDKLRAWSHVQLHPLTYERLELVGEGAPAEGARAAQLWVGLARAALATEASDERSPPTEPAVIAQAIDARPRGGGGAEAYDQVIVGYLLQIAQELKSAGGAEAVALRRRISRLIRSLRPETLRRLVEMGGDFAQRRQFVADAAAGMAADAVLEILKAAPGESPAEPERVVAMALEVETVGPRAVAAVEHIVEAGRLGALLEALQQVPDERGAARAVWERVATSDVVRRLVRADPPDFTVLDRLIPHVGYAAAEPLLDALAVAQSRGARRGLLAQLVRLGAGIGPLVVRRLEDDRWYVIRNLLALLEDLAVLP